MVSSNHHYKYPPMTGKRKPKKYHVCEKWFRKVYLDEMLPTRIIAEEIGCVNETVNTIAKQLGVPIRPRLPRSIPHPKLDLDVEEMARLYFDEELPCDKIGVIFNIHGGTVGKRLRAAGYKLRHHNDSKRGKPARNKIYIDPELVVELYSQLYVSGQTIADKFGVSRQVIDRILKEQGVPTKPKNETRNTWGENSPRWRHDLTEEERENRRDMYAHKLWRERVFERDEHTCQACSDASGGNLNAHHIIPHSRDKSVAWDLDNGITLCKSCHTSFHMQYGYTKCTRDDLNEFLEEVRSNAIS